jgi:hypothetical protein
VDCHFFVKTTRFSGADPFVQVVSTAERARVRTEDFGWRHPEEALSCYLGVWDEGVNFDVAKRAEVIARTDRRGFCFFWPARPGMLLPAARLLQEREAQAREASRDRRLALIGLWIAAAALVVNVALTVASALGWWPF